MRPIPAIACLIFAALCAVACGVPDPAAVSSGTPRPGAPLAVATPTGARPGLPPPEASGTAVGRLPQQPAAPTAKPAAATTYILDQALQKRLEDLLGDDAEHYGVYVKSLTSGKGAAINGDKVFNAASLFKVEVMYEVFRQRGLGLLQFDELMELTPYYADFDLGTLRFEVGQSVSIAEALYYMMSVSDNVSAVMLQDRAGAGNVNSTMIALGLKVSGLFTEGLPATADDFGILIEAIARSPDIDTESKQQMLDLMLTETIDNGLVAGVPPGTRVAHKTGNWPDATNDAGIVLAPGKDYVLVVLCDLGYSEVRTRSISQLVYDYFEGAAR